MFEVIAEHPRAYHLPFFADPDDHQLRARVIFTELWGFLDPTLDLLRLVFGHAFYDRSRAVKELGQR